MPLAASAMIVWMLSTLALSELAAAAALVAVSGTVYFAQERWRRNEAATRAETPSMPV